MYAKEPFHPIFNPEAQELLFGLDPVFHSIHQEHGSMAPTGRPAGFESLCRIILEQQVSISSGLAAYHGLSSKMDRFTPAEILCLSETDFKEAGISRQKTAYIQALAARVASGDLDLDKLHQLHPDEIRIKLIESKGIGHWTVDVYLLFCLQHPDVFPIGDLAARKAAERITGITDINLLTERIQTWAPVRSLAAFYLWHYYLESKRKK